MTGRGWTDGDYKADGQQIDFSENGYLYLAKWQDGLYWVCSFMFYRGKFTEFALSKYKAKKNTWMPKNGLYDKTGAYRKEIYDKGYVAVDNMLCRVLSEAYAACEPKNQTPNL